jgi:hypothetical protein
MKKTLFSLIFTIFSSFLMAQSSISIGRLSDNNSFNDYTTFGAMVYNNERTDLAFDFGFASFPSIGLRDIDVDAMLQFTSNYYFSKEKRRLFVGMKVLTQFYRNNQDVFVSSSPRDFGTFQSEEIILGAAFNAGCKFRLSKRIDFLLMYSRGYKAELTRSNPIGSFGFENEIRTFDFKLLYKLKN